MTDYHNLPGLSSSGARKLLPPSCPAKFKWELDNPPPPRDVFDFGHAAHRFVLGAGEDIARLDFPDWRTKAAKEARDEARDAGQVPLLAGDYDRAVAMSKALRANSLVGSLFTNGEAEVVKHWEDPITGTALRTKFDWLPNRLDERLPDVRFVPDYKTASSADPAEFARSAFKYGYHIQAAWYIDTLTTLGIVDQAVFVFVVQEKAAPYLASPVILDEAALEIGRHQYRKAIDIYARCVETGTWPGYAEEPVIVSPPSWALNEYLDDVAPDDIQAA